MGLAEELRQKGFAQHHRMEREGERFPDGPAAGPLCALEESPGPQESGRGEGEGEGERPGAEEAQPARSRARARTSSRNRPTTAVWRTISAPSVLACSAASVARIAVRWPDGRRTAVSSAASTHGAHAAAWKSCTRFTVESTNPPSP